MANPIGFDRKDIGPELLPILTVGLYRDVLDTLREYIQNAIDAGCKSIRVTIAPESVLIRDDGDGMTEERARAAIRLGVSDKNPRENVGFRGIGIYSAFNLCDQLTLYTCAANPSDGYRVAFDFQKMRNLLLIERDRRKQGDPPELDLEGMLEKTVSIRAADVTDQLGRAEPAGSNGHGPISGKGTLAELAGVLPDARDRLLDEPAVRTYLENNVPLPFHESFPYKDDLEREFTQRSGRVVPLKLKVGVTEARDMYRPYIPEMFTNHRGYPPKIYEVKHASRTFGFAWICHNDSRVVLPAASLRGLLIRRLDFAIGSRQLLEPFFGRVVFSRRITGEIIVTDPALIPNASRSDFEPNAARHSFFQYGIGGLLKQVEAYSDKLQREDKAKEVLEEVAAQLHAIRTSLPAKQGNIEQLLKDSAAVADLSRQLQTHRRTVKDLLPGELVATEELFRECTAAIQLMLEDRRRSQTQLEREVARVAQRREAGPPAKRPEAQRAQGPATLVALFEAYGLLRDPEVRQVIQILDADILRVHLDDTIYRDSLTQLRDRLEGRE